MRSKYFVTLFAGAVLAATTQMMQTVQAQSTAMQTKAFVQTKTLSAPEATQAAAADAEYAYAISSTKIAKYNRRTGERLAVSSGEAHHLNSGFVQGNTIYCAHSNYPQKPQKSQIMTLDTQTM